MYTNAFVVDRFMLCVVHVCNWLFFVVFCRFLFSVMVFFVSDEVVAIGKEVNKVSQKCGMKPIHVNHMETTIRHYYENVCPRTDTMWDIFVSNPGYNGLVHPMKPGIKDKNKFIPNFDYRYLTEDVPFGLLVIKAIGQMCENLRTPIMDMILLWCQRVMNKRYVKIDKIGSYAERYVKIDLASKDV